MEKDNATISEPRPWWLRAGQLLSTPRVKKGLAWFAALWFVFAVSAYFIAPPLLKSFLTEQLGQALAREVSIGEISVNPMTLSLRVDGLSIKDRSGREEQFGFGQLDINLSSFSLAQAGIVLDEIRLQAPRARLTRLADGQLDISDLLDKWASPPDKGPSPLPRFSLNNIRVSDGQLDLDDRVKGVRHSVSALHFNLPFISTLPYKADVFVEPSFSATVDGSAFAFKGHSKPFAPSHASELEFQLQHLELSRLQPYLPAAWPVRLKSGQLSTVLKLAFTQQTDGAPSAQLSGSAQLQSLALTEASGTPLLNIDQLELDLQTADPLQGRWHFAQGQLQGLRAGAPQPLPLRIDRLRVQQVSLDVQARHLEAAEMQATGAQANLLRTAQGELAWLRWPDFTPPRKTQTVQPGAQGTPATPNWVARVGHLSLEDAGLHFEDRSLSPPAVQTLEHVNLQADKLDSTPGHANAFSVAASFNQSGTLKATGAVQAQPLSVRLQLDTQAVPVSPLQGYIDAYLVGSRVQGQFSSQGELLIDQPKEGLNAHYKGTLNLGQFSVTDKANNADVLKWKSLYVGAVDFQLEPRKLNIGEIALSDFYSRLILNKDGRLNLADMVRSSPDAGAQDKGNAQASPPLPIKITKVTLQNGQVNFSDHFVRPNYNANITRLGGSVLNLSSAADTLAELDLRGSYASNAPVQISARLNPLSEKKFLDLKADVSSIDLVDLSPYSGKYAGYKIDKGKLSLNATYKLENRQLSADNRIFIDQLTFGEKVDSPDATQLPVHLAIALLKNNRGEIDIHLPISGSLDDPQFSVGGLVFKMIANLFVKAVTSPFALLGSLFGGQEELSQIVFAPGRASLDDAALKKLDILAKAMREREGLSLEITGSADQDTDLEGLKQAALERAMQAEKRKAIRKPSENVSDQDLRIAPDEYATYLAHAYQQARFPKPRNLIGLPKALPVEEMQKLMLTHLAIEDDDLRALATARAQAAQAWLIEQGGLPLGRIFLLPVQLGKATASTPQERRNRVDFSLR